MKDYIDLTELRKQMQCASYVITKSSRKNKEIDWMERKQVFQIINGLSAENVAACKPGRWVYPEAGRPEIRCSVCGKTYNAVLNRYYFCPMCGARMEG